MGREGTTSWDGNTSISSPRFKNPVLIGVGTAISPTRTGSQEIGSPKGPTGPVEVRNAQIFHTFITGNLTNNGDPMTTFRELIGREHSHDSSTKIYLRCRVNFMRNAIGTEIPDFMNLGLPAVHASDELGSFGTPATRVRRPTDEYN